MLFTKGGEAVELDGPDVAARALDPEHLDGLASFETPEVATLGEFRNSLVGQVGPALSAHTTALFRELTDGRFDSLEVDGDTFELRVGSAGHPLDRHSGSETDLANLSLRVAIGEQVNLLSGGAVGLLVLDEVLGAVVLQRDDEALLFDAIDPQADRRRAGVGHGLAGREEGESRNDDFVAFINYRENGICQALFGTG